MSNTSRTPCIRELGNAWPRRSEAKSARFRRGGKMGTALLFHASLAFAGPPPDPGNGSANTWAEGWPPFPRRRLIACTRRARQLLDRCYRLSGLARGIKDSVSLFGCWNETEGWNSFVRPVVGILKFSDRAINRPFVRFPSRDIYVKEVFYDRTSNKSSFSPVDQSILCAICKSFLMNFLFLQVIYKYVDRTYTFNPKIQS